MKYKAEIALTRNDICEIIAKYLGVEKEDVKIGLAFTADNGDKDLAGKVYKDIMIPDNPNHTDPILIPEVPETWDKVIEYLKGKKDEQNT